MFIISSSLFLFFLGACNPVSASALFQSSNADLTISISLCDNPPCSNNTCPGILAPQAMGYDTVFSSNAFIDLTFNMVTFYNALAVNLGMA